MTQETKYNIMERRAIPDLLDKKYYIPEYQRGYRWEEKQVLDLLDDLNTFFCGETKGRFYCLQPIVVKEIELGGEKWYEVIDGQQRLTTLRLVMQVFDQLNRSMFGPAIRHGYTIRYATRPNMQDIFDTITIIGDAQGDVTIDDSQNQWQKQIDSLYIYNAAKTILKWFFEDQARKSSFGQYFYNKIDNDTKSVQVVWYETVEEKEPHDIFNRMNSLKVELSCSELIRSLFLSSCTEFKLGDLNGLSESLQNEIRKERFNHKQTSINEKWDELEQQMRDKSFQSFLTRRKDTGRNAIGLLFDLMSGKYAADKVVPCRFPNLHKEDELYTYLYFKALIEEDKDAWQTWEKVLNSFEKIQYWYNDRGLFHRIGFLNAIASRGHEDDAICQLLTLKEGRHALYEKVVTLIRESMTLPENKDTRTPIDSLEKLSYDNPTHYNYIKQLLLLYNVETSRRQTSGDYFSFNRYRYAIDGKEKTWTLEHIHAQNSDCLPETNKDSWYEWIRYNLESLKKLSLGDPALINAQNEVVKELERDSNVEEGSGIPICKTKNYTFDNIKAVFESVVDFYAKLDSKADKAKPVHQLSNMALLDLGQNAMVGKSPFEVKRQLICNEIADNEYFPICTRKVFLKLYDKESIQVHSWSQRDRELYYDDMKEKLSLYINNTAF